MDEKSDEELLTEYYSRFKDQKDDKKYSLIPKFYSKASSHLRILVSNHKIGAKVDQLFLFSLPLMTKSYNRSFVKRQGTVRFIITDLVTIWYTGTISTVHAKQAFA